MAWRDFGRSCLSSEVMFEEASVSLWNRGEWSRALCRHSDHFCFFGSGWNNVASPTFRDLKAFSCVSSQSGVMATIGDNGGTKM